MLGDRRPNIPSRRRKFRQVLRYISFTHKSAIKLYVALHRNRVLDCDWSVIFKSDSRRERLEPGSLARATTTKATLRFKAPGLLVILLRRQPRKHRIVLGQVLRTTRDAGQFAQNTADFSPGDSVRLQGLWGHTTQRREDCHNAVG